MPNSWAASLPAVGANNGGNVSLTFSNLRDAANAAYTLVQDDVVIAAYACSGTADFAMATSSAGWTLLGEHYSNGTLDTNVAVFAKKMTASPDASSTFTGPGGASNGTIGVAAVLKGADIAALDVAAVLAAGTGTSVPNPGAITPATAGAFICVVGAGTAAAGAVFTNPGDLATATNHFRSGNHAETNDIAIGMGFKENWTSGAFDPAAWGGGNVNASNSWAAITLAIRPVAVTLAGTGAVAFADAADMALDKALAGTAAVAFEGTADLIVEAAGGDELLAGTGDLAFGGDARLAADRMLTGADGIGFGATAGLAAVRGLAALGSFSLVGSALLDGVGGGASQGVQRRCRRLRVNPGLGLTLR